MLEASDVDNLLEKFEDASQDYSIQEEEGDEKTNNTNPKYPSRHSGPLTFSRSSQDPHKKSQIIAAVQNHFSISSSNDLNSSLVDPNAMGKKPPRIGKNISYIGVGMCEGESYRVETTAF